jgi:hypothetical protein
MVINDARDLVLNDLTLRTPAAEAPMIELRDVSGASMSGISVPQGAVVGVHVTGAQTSDIRFGENDLSSAKEPIRLDASVKPGAITPQREPREVSGRD